jgi:hypothetical protein
MLCWQHQDVASALTSAPTALPIHVRQQLSISSQAVAAHRDTADVLCSRTAHHQSIDQASSVKLSAIRTHTSPCAGTCCAFRVHGIAAEHLSRHSHQPLNADAGSRGLGSITSATRECWLSVDGAIRIAAGCSNGELARPSILHPPIRPIPVGLHAVCRDKHGNAMCQEIGCFSAIVGASAVSLEHVSLRCPLMPAHATVACGPQ